ncbi:MAG: hypothetical protein ACOYNO_14680 [Saprospiraceae bacterium]|jgi:hypothetical protein
MKKHLLIAVLLGAIGTLAYAQPDPDQMSQNPRINQYRIAIFTEVLQLTPEEAQMFWPVYNQYLAKKEDIRKSGRPVKPIDNMSDAEIEDQLKRHFETQARLLDLDKQLVEDLRKVLPVRKIAKLNNAEKEFRASLLKKLQEARALRQERKGLGRPGGN